MPEYLAPGVYVEETGFRAKSIEGVGTSTAAFVGPARKGPFRADVDAHETPELLTSYRGFERIYGNYADLALGAGIAATNYLAHAVLAFFNEGGSRLYVSRAVGAGAAAATVRVSAGGVPAAEEIVFVCRSPGVLGNGRITVREIVSPASATTMAGAPAGTLLLTHAVGGVTQHVKVGRTWRPANHLRNSAEDAAALAAAAPRIATLSVVTIDGDGTGGTMAAYEGLGYDPTHPNWVGHAMSETPSRRSDHLQNAFAMRIGGNVTALALHQVLFTGATANAHGQLERSYALTGGRDGAAPTAANYALALGEIERLEDVSIVAAPGAQAYAEAQAINRLLISHAEAPGAYRIAVLDTPPQQTPVQVRALRGLIDSSHAAIYYPWVVANPSARAGRNAIPPEIVLPPSGFMCGIYARNDVQRGVSKAPANEVVRGALHFEIDVNSRQQAMLDPLGVNCLRLLPGRGCMVWGARLVSSDPEWKYVNLRRYFNYIEASIDRGTQWAVFEPNDERLWANVRQTIADFLTNEWRGGALSGSTPEQDFFVRCDRSTMTQSDIDNGRLICLIGVALIKPAEFIIFRIGQKTADAHA